MDEKYERCEKITPGVEGKKADAGVEGTTIDGKRIEAGVEGKRVEGTVVEGTEAGAVRQVLFRKKSNSK